MGDWMSKTFLNFNDYEWQNFKKELKKVVGDTAYNNLLKKLGFISIEDNTISLSVPTKFLRDWIVNHYTDKIKNHCKKYNNSIEILKFVVKPVGGRIVPGTARTIKHVEKKWSNNY